MKKSDKKKIILALDDVYSMLLTAKCHDEKLLCLIDELQNEIEGWEGKVNCDDCGDNGELRGWKYEPSVKLCENCFESRMNEDEEN